VHALREFIPAGESFLVHYGDILTSLNLRQMRAQHQDTGALVTVGLVNDVEVHAGVADLDKDNRVMYFEEKPKVGRPCHAAVDMFGPGIWSWLAPGLDFGYDVIPKLVAAGEDVRGFLDDAAWWLDVGRISDLEEATALMQRVGWAPRSAGSDA
jgi:mannose-1-phosphate guanylyltransferase